ncbi:MAG TPA: sigma factor-like helix-turn-helix DNA-binding protein [Streptosporangiaceae bacterium]
MVALRYRDGLTTEEIARQLGCPVGTVRSCLCRAYASLRAAFHGGRLAEADHSASTLG